MLVRDRVAWSRGSDGQKKERVVVSQVRCVMAPLNLHWESLHTSIQHGQSTHTQTYICQERIGHKHRPLITHFCTQLHTHQHALTHADYSSKVGWICSVYLCARDFVWNQFGVSLHQFYLLMTNWPLLSLTPQALHRAQTRDFHPTVRLNSCKLLKCHSKWNETKANIRWMESNTFKSWLVLDCYASATVQNVSCWDEKHID